MTTTETGPQPNRGEVWRVRFDPAKGAEINKLRPAIVVSPPTIGRLPLRIVVPVTGWKPAFASSPWHVYLAPNKRNGLSKESAADAFQVKSVAVSRFEECIGVVNADDLEDIAAAVALCVGF